MLIKFLINMLWQQSATIIDNRIENFSKAPGLNTANITKDIFIIPTEDICRKKQPTLQKLVRIS